MSYRIDFEFGENYLEVRAFGPQTLENNIEFAKKVYEEFDKSGLERILVDIRGFEGQPGTAADIEYAKLIKGMVENKKHKIALIFRKENEQYTRFFETTLVNRGINIKIFIDSAEAQKWVTL
jgi:hypothetical protein